jgi:hypothetical protein
LKRLDFRRIREHRYGMQKPSKPVQLSVEQIQDLNEKLSVMRHDINNQLSLILAASELIQHKPQMAERMMNTVTEQPPKITAAIAKFSEEFESVFGISRS